MEPTRNMNTNGSARIHHSALKDLSVTRCAKITNVQQISSYNWIEADMPTIVIPGVPPSWTPLEGVQRLKRDSGFFYISQNAARHPSSPLEPLFRSVYALHPTFAISSIDVVSDRSNIRKLFHFVTTGDCQLETFAIQVEVIKDAAILSRSDTATTEFIGVKEFRGYGHEFEKRYTTSNARNYTGHYRVISYRFCGMKLLVRHETDAYVKEIAACTATPATEPPEILSESKLGSSEYISVAGSKLRVGCGGRAVPIQSTLEIKTRAMKKPLDFNEVAPQLWVSQTPNLVRAYHQGGKFSKPEVEDVTRQIRDWETANQSDLAKLGGLIQWIVSVAKKLGKATIRYDVTDAELVVEQSPDSPKLFPEDLYVKSEVTETRHQGPRQFSGPKNGNGLNYGGGSDSEEGSTRDSADSSASAVKQTGRDNIPFSDIVQIGKERGFRQFFRHMQTSLAQYRVLCESLETLKVDVLQGRQVRELMADLRHGKDDWDRCDRRRIVGRQAEAQDSAFRLLYLLLRGRIHDRNAAYNATLFVVSHFQLFGWRARKMVREALEDTAMPSAKQRKELDKWPVEESLLDNDETTDEEESSK